MSVDRTEQVLIRILVSLLFLLLVSQTLMLKEEWRPYLSTVDRLEGQDLSGISETPEQPTSKPAAYSNFLRKSQAMTIRMFPTSRQGIKLLINGTEAAVFDDLDVKVSVYEGDYIEIDASNVIDKTKFVVHVPSKFVQYPPDGLLIEGCGKILAVGQVKFKK